MAHATFNIDNHHEGNAFKLPVEVYDEATDERLDLTNTEADYYIKETRSDPDEEALVHKTGEEGVSEDEIEFDASDGELTIYIDTDETAGHIDWEQNQRDDKRSPESYDLWHRLDITDANGNRVTVFTGHIELIDS